METLRQRFSARSRADSVPVKGGPRRDGEAEGGGERGRSGGGKHGDGILNRNILSGMLTSQPLGAFRRVRASGGSLQTHLKVLKVLFALFSADIPTAPGLVKAAPASF